MADRIIYLQNGIPTAPDDIIHYQYDPSPPEAIDPPISAHEFELALRVCQPGCKIAYFHDCIRSPSGDLALRRTPKRKGLLEIGTDAQEFAWGLQAQYVISMLHMVFYYVLILGGPFGIFFWWLRHHPGDLVNASVPSITAAILLSCTSLGVLKVRRELQ